MNASTTTTSPISRFSCRRAPAAKRDAQVAELMPFVESVARRVSRDIRGKIDLEELISWGVTGLLESIDRYDPAQNASLKTYSFYRIRGAMLDNIGKLAPLTRSGYRCAGAAGDFHAIYRADIEPGRIHDAESPSPEDQVMQQQDLQVLSRAMQCLKKDHRHVLQEHYFGGQSLKAAGMALGKSKSWACRSHAAALEALRQVMENEEAVAA